MSSVQAKLYMIGMTAAVLVSAFAAPVASQKPEHYNSPLYSPRTYDPAAFEPNGLPPILKEAGIEQKLGAKLPLDAELKNEAGQIVKLGDYFRSGKPAVLAFVYYECPMLCSQVLNGLTGSLKGMSFDAGKEFDVIALSFDAREFDKPELARNKKANYVERYGRPGSEKGWHFLTGNEESIRRVTDAAGFSFKWDEKSNQFAHAAAVMVVTPDGTLSHYFYGIDYSPKDLKFGLMEAGQSKVGNAAERLLLYCYHYDPSTGRYGLAVMRVMRLGAVATLIGIGGMVFVLWRRNKRRTVDGDVSDTDPMSAGS